MCSACTSPARAARCNRRFRAACSLGRWSGFASRRAGGALPLPLAGEGWGEGVSASGQSPRGKNPHPPRSASVSASPASGRGGASPQTILVKSILRSPCLCAG
ncbi:hypothetical protein EAS54_36310 [Bradyrhizobium guangzhouense]|nr:hypothetical protein EAS54_36310 [Bradyrhizobium guangzhouense]